MYKTAWLLILISTLFLLSCEKENESIPEFQLDEADNWTDDEYHVYNAILRKLNPIQGIIRQQTSIYTPPMENFQLFFKLEKLAEMESALFSHYVDANEKNYLLDDKIAAPDININLIANKEYAIYFNREDLYKGWALFGKKYPDAGKWFYGFNKIGFNESRTQAIVGLESYWFMDSQDGPTLEIGMLFYLEKKNDVWEYIHSTSYSL